MNTSQTSSDSVRVRELLSGESLRRFLDLGWSLNKHDPNWVSPLRMSVKAALDRNRHPFHKHSEVAYFIAERNGKPVGRIAGILNRRHNHFHQDKTGFFGLFEAENDPSVAIGLLGAAEDWLRAKGCDSMRGPFNFSTNEEIASPGVLIDGFEIEPSIMMTHNPRYYAALLEGAGLTKCKDLVAIWFDAGTERPDRRGSDAIDLILGRHNANVRTVNLKKFSEEVETVRDIYNSAWSLNWGFVPVTDEEFDYIAKEFKPVVDPDLCLIAEVEGEPVGFSLALPNLNDALRHVRNGRLFPSGLLKLLWYKRKVGSVRIITFGFKPKYQQAGLGVGFYFQTWQTAIDKGFRGGECSWILEDNHKMLRPLERMGGRRTRLYRIFEKSF